MCTYSVWLFNVPLFALFVFILIPSSFGLISSHYIPSLLYLPFHIGSRTYLSTGENLLIMSSTADLKAQKRQKFEKVFEVIREELLTHFNGEGMPKEASEWYRQVRTISFLPSFFFFFF